MKLEQYKKPSAYLISLSSLILLLGFMMAFLLHRAAKNLEDDARIINEAGIIRGSIQRVTKLVLSDPGQSSSEIIVDINRLIAQFSSMEKKNGHRELEKHFYGTVADLKEKWQSLEKKLTAYQQTQSEAGLRQILKESEDCWLSAVAVVHMAQQVTEDKVKDVKQVFYIILAFTMVDTLLIIIFVVLYVKKKLEYENVHDPLTSLYNRRSYEQVMEAELDRSHRYRSSLSLILFDIDYFKKINDSFGHKAGDQVLITLAKRVQSVLRESDAVFRVGGEEFAIVAPETGAEGAFKLAEKIREDIASCRFGACNQVTISLGVAESYPGVTEDNLFKHADNALYLAKNSGRNCTEVFSKESTLKVWPDETLKRSERSVK